jgi:hypothetical protein
MRGGMIMIRQTAGTAAGFLALALVLVSGAACGDSPTGADGMVDSGSWYRTGFRWPHDGAPYESANFIVYSDAASFESRRKLAEIGEGLMVDLVDDFQIDPEGMFRWPPGQSKLHIYTFKNHDDKSWGGWGYYGGLMIYSLDHPVKDTELGNYSRVVTHELMHATEGLMKGTDNPRLVDVWLTEGIAEYVAGGTSSSGSITALATMDSLVATYGAVNPIAMHRYEDYPDVENLGYKYLYAMFELATGYLLHPDGLGRPESAIRDIYLDVRNGRRFSDAFEEQFGLSLQQFEDEFWGRMRDFLE